VESSTFNFVVARGQKAYAQRASQLARHRSPRPLVMNQEIEFL